MKSKFSRKSGHSGYSVLILICTLIGSALAAVLVTRMQEKAVEKKRLKQELAERTESLKEENYGITYVVNPKQPSNSPTPNPTESAGTSTLRVTNASPKPSPPPAHPASTPASEVAGPANLPGYIPISRRTNVTKVTFPAKNTKVVDGKRIAFP